MQVKWGDTKNDPPEYVEGVASRMAEAVCPFRSSEGVSVEASWNERRERLDLTYTWRLGNLEVNFELSFEIDASAAPTLLRVNCLKRTQL